MVLVYLLLGLCWGLAGFWFSVLLLVVFVFCLLIGLVFGLVGLAVGP